MSGKTDRAGSGIRDIRRLAVGYVRVSTKGQGNSGISLEAQKDAIMQFAHEMDYTLVEIFQDVASGVGARSFIKRDGLKAALDFAAHENAILIVWDWDRLSRFSGFENQVREVLADSNRFICAKKGTQLRDASQAATFAHNERTAKEIARTTKEAMAKKSAAGAVFGNPTISTKVQPLGVASYSNASENLARRIAEVLRDLDDPFGVTYGEIARILNEKGIRTLQGNNWNADRARPKVRKARELLRKEEEGTRQSNPSFGMF